MEIIRGADDMRAAMRLWRKRSDQPIGLAPTMGGLHEGHLTLIRALKRDGCLPVASVFVNPLQFGPGEDYARYPRTFERDCALCEAEGVAYLFAPSAAEMYPPGHSVFVDEDLVTRGLCGARRPGHFRGVATVVAKLFHLVNPDVAAFGRKDAQQARLIEKMARDLSMGVRILVCPIAREPDGLAMSSRNRYLDAEARRQAVCLVEGLRRVRALYAAGERRAAAALEAVAEEVAKRPPAVLEYAEVVDGDTFQPVDTLAPDTLVLAAARVAGTRLIDNLWITARGEPDL